MFILPHMVFRALTFLRSDAVSLSILGQRKDIGFFAGGGGFSLWAFLLGGPFVIVEEIEAAQAERPHREELRPPANIQHQPLDM